MISARLQKILENIETTWKNSKQLGQNWNFGKNGKLKNGETDFFGILGKNVNHGSPWLNMDIHG